MDADWRRFLEAAAGHQCSTAPSTCYSALFKAGRHEELLELLDLTPQPGWHDLVWGGRVLVARGAVDEAIENLVRRGGVNTPPAALARFAEEALLQDGRRVQAYQRYAIAPH